MIAPCIRNSVSIVFFVPVFFSRQNYSRPTRFSNILQKQGGEGRRKKKCQNYGKFDNDSKIRSRLQKCIAHGQMRIIDE